MSRIAVACLGRQESLPHKKAVWFVLFQLGLPPGDPQEEEYATKLTNMTLQALYKNGVLKKDEALMAFAMRGERVQPVYMTYASFTTAKKFKYPEEEVKKIYLKLFTADRTNDKEHIAVIFHAKDGAALLEVSQVEVLRIPGPLTIPDVPRSPDGDVIEPPFAPTIFGLVKQSP